MSTTTSSTCSVSAPWRHVPCELDAGPTSRAAIGLITLPNDVTIETELRSFLPLDGVCVLATRIPLPVQGTVDSLRSMEQHLTQAAALIAPVSGLDVIAYGCTSGSMAIGPDVVERRIKAARPEVACANPVSSALKGLRVLDCTRIAVLNPYSDEVNEVVGNHVTSQGFDIVASASFKQIGDRRITRVPPDAIFDAGLGLAGRSDVEALFISCTALRVSPIIDRLEAALGKPVVSSNQALAWDCLRLSGCHEPILGFGQLLAQAG